MVNGMVMSYASLFCFVSNICLDFVFIQFKQKQQYILSQTFLTKSVAIFLGTQNEGKRSALGFLLFSPKRSFNLDSCWYLFKIWHTKSWSMDKVERVRQRCGVVSASVYHFILLIVRSMMYQSLPQFHVVPVSWSLISSLVITQLVVRSWQF